MGNLQAMVSIAPTNKCIESHKKRQIDHNINGIENGEKEVRSIPLPHG